MAEKHKPSGSEFRKRRQLMEIKKSKLPKISFFPGSTDVSEKTTSSGSEELPSTSRETLAETIEKTSENTKSMEETDLSEKDIEFEQKFLELSAEFSVDILSHPILGKLAREMNPTDRGHYAQTVEDVDIKKFIIKYGSCRPKEPFPKKQYPDCKRSFSTHYYSFRNKSRLELPRFWLCYSPILDTSYCEPCWLFADRSSKNINFSCISGISDWRGLTKKIQHHEVSEQHLTSCTVYELWKSGKTIDGKMASELEKEKQFWRLVLQRILNVILTLATNNIPLRGHRESVEVGKVEGGNFLAIIQLLSEYDPVLKELINMPSKIKYLSPGVQNELIELLSQRVETKILNDIRKSAYFSLILDTTQDISKIDQVSIIVRYVTISKDETNRPLKIHINESFLGFHHLSDQSSAGFQELIVNFFKTKNININKCRRQGYDGASVMSGYYKALQARISAIEKGAKYVHCAAHRLNLVINDAVSGVNEVTTFFQILQNIYVFFNNSISRWDLLKASETEVPLTLKKLCPTRWFSRNDSLTALRYRFSDMLKALSEICLKSKKNDEKVTAIGFLKNISRFEFIVLVVIFEKILNLINSRSKYLQSTNADIGEALNHLENALKQLHLMRNSFDEYLNIAKCIASKWGVKAEFEIKRNKRIRNFFDELAQDSRFDCFENKFKVEIFNKVLDIIIFQINIRFKGLKYIVNTFSVLTAKFLMEASDDESFESAKKLSEEYCEDLSDMFPSQMISFRNFIKNRLRLNLSVKYLASLLICDNYILCSSFSEVCSAYILYQLQLQVLKDPFLN